MTDGDGGTSIARTRAATITKVNDAPTVTLTVGSVSYTEGAAPTLIDTLGNVVDPDSTNFDLGVLTVSLTAGGTSDDRIEIRNQGTATNQIGVSGNTVTYSGISIGTFSGGVGTTPLTVNLDPDATIVATRALIRNLTFRVVGDTPSSATRTVQIQLSDGDGGTSNAAGRNVDVTPVNDAPVLALPGAAPTYTASGPAVVIDGSATIADPDSADFDSGVLTISLQTNGNADDRLEILNEGTGSGQIGISGSNVTYEGTTIGSFSGGVGTTPLSITLNAFATRIATETLMCKITFRSVNATPPTAARTVAFQLTDGDTGTSNTATKSINVVL